MPSRMWGIVLGTASSCIINVISRGGSRGACIYGGLLGALSPEHPVDVAVVEEENGIERRRFVLAHIPVAPHDLHSSADHQ